MSHTVKVGVSLKQQYNIRVERNIAQAFRDFCAARYSPQQAILVIDEKVRRLHGDMIESLCEEYFQHITLRTVPEGEQSKSLEQWQQLLDKILTGGVERSTPLVAVGGGVTGDLAGYVAASALRGIPLIHIPTSLLAMVDSSIGGKTGINHAAGKNLIGAFYQPDAVFSGVDFLATLEQKEWITGLAEILKYGAIRNPNLFERLEKLTDRPLKPSDEWMEVVAESAGIKADIVQEDTLEAGKRAYLNFGHTFGHALEKVAGYGALSHGEAVFVGMIAAVHFSKNMGYPVDDIRFDPFLSLYKQQIRSLPTDINALIEAMKTDKKVKDNTIRLVLLKKWGSPYIQPCQDIAKLKETWKYTLSQFTK